MKPVRIIAGRAVPLDRSDVDTDKIAGMEVQVVEKDNSRLLGR